MWKNLFFRSLGLSVSIQSGSVASSSGPGPIPIPDISQYETMQAGNPALANAVTSMKQQVQNILSKQMQLLALQQEKQKLQGNLQEHVGKSRKFVRKILSPCQKICLKYIFPCHFFIRSTSRHRTDVDYASIVGEYVRRTDDAQNYPVYDADAAFAVPIVAG